MKNVEAGYSLHNKREDENARLFRSRFCQQLQPTPRRCG